MLLNRAGSQLLIVDVQEKLLPAIHEKDRVLANCDRLLAYAKRLGVPITLSEQYPQGLGSTVEPLRTNAGNDAMVFSKVAFSCMRDATLQDHLIAHRRAGRGQVVVAGIETHVCVAQTVLDLLEEGFAVFVVADAVGSRTASSRRLALQRLARTGAEVVDNEMVMFEWLEKAGTPEFKELQALLK